MSLPQDVRRGFLQNFGDPPCFRSVAIVLAAMTIAGTMSPILLLLLTFALSAGDAFETPTWRAVLPELVAKEDFEAASALNGIEFNLARAIGPGLAGLLIASFGAGAYAGSEPGVSNS